VDWANVCFPGSKDLEDLDDSFRENVEAFIGALEAAGATVHIRATYRPPQRAYLFHWSWMVATKHAKPAAANAKPMQGVDIDWDHGDLDQSVAAAREMADGFGLALPGKPNGSNKAPALRSNHTQRKAIDMAITWKHVLKVALQDGTVVDVPYMASVDSNTKLHAVGASYSVYKLVGDAPHWSFNGH
jgi:hypothetical protein